MKQCRVTTNQPQAPRSLKGHKNTETIGNQEINYTDEAEDQTHIRLTNK